MHKRISIEIHISKYLTKKTIFTCLLTVFFPLANPILFTSGAKQLTKCLTSIFSEKKNNNTKQQTSDGTSYLKVLI